MSFVHAREHLHAGDVVIVNCTHQCNVRLMEDSDFQSFQNGGSHHYHGGFFQRLPARVGVPHTGYWNVTVDLGGSSSAFRYGISYQKSRAA